MTLENVHTKTGPFSYQTCFDHLVTGNVRKPKAYCIVKQISYVKLTWFILLSFLCGSYKLLHLLMVPSSLFHPGGISPTSRQLETEANQ